MVTYSNKEIIEVFKIYKRTSWIETVF